MNGLSRRWQAGLSG